MNMLKRPAFLIFYAFLLMIVALYNGYPLVESDTGAYIEHGFRFHFPADRPPFYGVFLRITALWTSLWLPVFAQSLLLAYLLRRYIRFLYPEVDIYSEVSCIIIIIAFTCVAWVSAYLMPDVFAGILLLSLLLYLYDIANTGKLQNITYLAIIVLAIIVHNSHFLVTGVFAALVLLSAIWKKNRMLVTRSIMLIGICAGFWLGMSTINFVRNHGFTFSKGSHVFMVTKFAETGILKKYLDDNCEKKNLKLCPYKDQIPAYSWDFLWDQNGPLYKTGGWEGNREEFGIIIHDVLTTPKYLKMYIWKSMTSTLKELCQIHAPDNTSRLGVDSEPWKRIKDYYNDELSEYVTGRQVAEGGPSGSTCNTFYYLFLVISGLLLLFHKHIFTEELKVVYTSIFIFFVINAFATATLSTVHYRFQYRIFWILPATNAIVLIRYYYNKYSQTKVNNQ